MMRRGSAGRRGTTRGDKVRGRSCQLDARPAVLARAPTQEPGGESGHHPAPLAAAEHTKGGWPKLAHWDERYTQPQDTPDDPAAPAPWWLMAGVLALGAIGLMLAAGILH